MNFKIKNKIGLFFFAIILLIPGLALANKKIENSEVKRLAGPTRYETAVEVSKENFKEGADALIIVSGESYPDSLSATGLIRQENAPMLLVHKDSIPDSVQNEIQRLNPSRVYVVGGEEIISKEVENSLPGQVERIGGKDRYETSRKILERDHGVQENQPDQPIPVRVAVVSGANSSDPITAASLLLDKVDGILLVDPTTKTSFDDKIQVEYIVGGEKSIPLDSFEAGGKSKAKRLAGSNRYETARAVLGEVVNESTRQLTIASGEDFPDALVASVNIIQNQAPLALVKRDSLDENLREYFISKADRLSVIGGENAVSVSLYQILEGKELDQKDLEERNADDFYQYLSNLNFYLNPQSEDWSSWMKLSQEGTFTAGYREEEKDQTYAAEAKGKFSFIRKVDENTFEMVLESLENTQKPGTSISKPDGSQTTYIKGLHGLTKGGLYRLYLSGRTTGDFSDKLRSWMDLEEEASQITTFVIHDLGEDFAWTNHED